MRWVVELPAPSGGTAATVTVDAESWAGALTHARGGSPVKKFRCEFDAENVVRVLDLSTREWYTIRPIRSVAPEAPSPAPGSADEGAVASSPPAAQPFPPALDEPPAPTAPPSDAATATHEADAPPAQAGEAPTEAAEPEEPMPGGAATEAAEPEEPMPGDAPTAAAKPEETTPAARPTDTLFGVPPPRGEESRLVAVDESGEHHAVTGGVAPHLLFERDQDPSQTNPLTYRERVFAVPEGTSADEAEQIARHALSALRRSLATRPRGRYVVVAVFDHRFKARPERAALVELRWKDWRGEPEVSRPSAGAPVNGAAHHAATVDAAEAASADASGGVTASVVLAAATPESSAESAEAPAMSAPPPAPREAPAESAAPAAEVGGEASLAVGAPPAQTPTDDAEALVSAAVEAPTVVAPEASAAAEAASPVAEAPPPSPAVEVAADAEASVVPPATEVAVVTTAPQADAPAPPPDAVGPSPGEAVTQPEVPSVVLSESLVPSLSPPPVDEQQAEAPTAEAPLSAQRAARRLTRRLRGKDLLSELFDALMDLSHMDSVEAGCGRVSQILLDHVQCDLAAVSVYDINRDEFVVAAAAGLDGLDGRRERAAVGVAAAVVTRREGLMLASCEGDNAFHDELRGGAGVFAPAMYRERLFALVRLQRVPGAAPFEGDELDALSYVAGQLGEFLSTQSTRAAAVVFAPEPRRSVAPPKR